jgi:hypothetical protein
MMYGRSKGRIVMAALLVILVLVVGGTAWYAWNQNSKSQAAAAVPALTPEQALEKYQWFIEQSAKIQQADTDITYWQGQRQWYEETFVYFYGPDKTKWAPGIRAQYDEDIRKSDVGPLISSRNQMVEAYNVDSDAFDWAPFAGKPDLPPEHFPLE